MRAPRAQPKGLKARYQPFGVNSSMGKIGFDAESDKEASVEAEDEQSLPAVPRVRAPEPPAKKDRKRKSKAEEAGADTPVPEPAKKKKKRSKQMSSDDEAAAAASQLMEESMTAGARSSQRKAGQPGSPDLGSAELVASPGARQIATPPPLTSQLGSSQLTSNVVGRSASPATGSSLKKHGKVKSTGPARKVLSPAPAEDKKTPVAPRRQTAVPLPPIPGSSQAAVSPVAVPQFDPSKEVHTPSFLPSDKKLSKRNKESKKESKKSRLAGHSSRTDAQASAQQPSGRSKETPVPLPNFTSSS